MPAARRVLLLILALLFLLLFLAVPTVSIAQDPVSPAPLADAARQLAQRLASSLPVMQALSLSLQNRSELGASETAEVYREVRAELLRQNKRIVANATGVPHVRITLSENPQGLLWIAEVLGPDFAGIVTVQPARPTRYPSAVSIPRLFLKDELLWEQAEPILDLTLRADSPASASEMLVLEPARIVAYRKEGGRWTLSQFAALTPPAPPSRDPRGRIERGIGKFDLRLPGAKCEARILDSLMTTCELGTFPWPEFNGMVPGRNYFAAGSPSARGASGEVPPYFSQATLPYATQSATIMFAGIDGRTRVLDDSGEAHETEAPGWGSDLATLGVGCATGAGPGGVVLATGPGDWTQNDAVTAYAFVDRRPIPASPPLAFAGPVTALWPMSDEEALVVVRNLKSGQYEAHRLTVSCGQ